MIRIAGSCCWFFSRNHWGEESEKGEKGKDEGDGWRMKDESF
jgi:hypothetical protein